MATQATTLRTEVHALQRLLRDDDHPWMGMDKAQRENIVMLLDMALKAPDTTE